RAALRAAAAELQRDRGIFRTLVGDSWPLRPRVPRAVRADRHSRSVWSACVFSAAFPSLMRIAFLFLIVFSAFAAEPPKPNLIFILSDNHGAWTLGCYGNNDIRTPNIDRLATEGTLFIQAFCANPVCSPSRATFLTGLIPSQHGVHSYLGADT